MEYDSGSILQFTPHTSTLEAHFVNNEQRWKLSIIGWAVVVQRSPSGSRSTELQPVIIWDNRAITVAEYLFLYATEGELAEIS